MTSEVATTVNNRSQPNASIYSYDTQIIAQRRC